MPDDIRGRVFGHIDENWPEQVAFLREIVGHRSELLAEKGVQLVMKQKFAAMGLDVDTFDADMAQLSRLPGFSPIEWGFQGRPQVVAALRAGVAGRPSSSTAIPTSSRSSRCTTGAWTRSRASSATGGCTAAAPRT
jgi:acetylornithine deacetylase